MPPVRGKASARLGGGAEPESGDPGAAMSEYRRDRLADRIRSEVAGMIESELKDPRIGFTTVTRVDLSADLRRARILVSVLGDERQRQETLCGLASATGYVRHEVGRRLRVRHVPELSFALDRSLDEAEHIEELLQGLRRGAPDNQG